MKIIKPLKGGRRNRTFRNRRGLQSNMLMKGGATKSAAWTKNPLLNSLLEYNGKKSEDEYFNFGDIKNEAAFNAIAVDPLITTKDAGLQAELTGKYQELLTKVKNNIDTPIIFAALPEKK